MIKNCFPWLCRSKYQIRRSSRHGCICVPSVLAHILNVLGFYVSKLDVRKTKKTAAISWKPCSLVGHGVKTREQRTLLLNLSGGVYWGWKFSSGWTLWKQEMDLLAPLCHNQCTRELPQLPQTHLNRGSIFILKRLVPQDLKMGIV